MSCSYMYIVSDFKVGLVPHGGGLRRMALSAPNLSGSPAFELAFGSDLDSGSLLADPSTPGRPSLEGAVRVDAEGVLRAPGSCDL